MKLKLSHAKAAAAQMPEGYVAEVMAAGVVDGEHLIISDADYLRLTLKYAPLKKDFTAERETICAGCEWNVNWICEHPGCQPCRQRLAGGLKRMITSPGSRCPESKW